MRKIAFVLFGVISVALTALPVAAQRGGRGRQVELPTGPARKVILKSCTVCHGLDPYATKALDKDGWKAEIDSMKAKGAVISDEDASILLDYLVSAFGPNSAPVAPPVRAVAANPAADAAAKKILDTACTACHSLQRIDAQSQTAEAWEGIVSNMRRRGARVTDDDVAVLTEYLGRTHGPQ